VLFREFAQAIRTKTIAAVYRDRQPEGFVAAPARPRQAAIEFSATAVAGEAAGRLNF
jgi:hypothetical protein